MNAPARIGRPPQPIDAELASKVCERIAEGASLRAIRDELGVSAAAISYWCSKDDTFAEQYAQARKLNLDVIADELIPIADDDSLKPEDRKVRVDTRKWLLSKLASQTYGDKLDVTSKGEALAAPSHMVDARVQSIVMQAAMRMAGELGDETQRLLE